MFIIRPLAPDADLPDLTRLRTCIAQADQTGDAISEAALQERLTWPNQDPLKDHWVAEAPERPGELLGYATLITHIPQRADALLEVHPDWRRRGLGSALLRRLLQRASEKEVQDVAFYEPVAQVAAQAFLSQAGFERAGEAWELQAGMDSALAAPAWPPGYSVQTYAQAPDLARLLAVCNRSRRDMWGHWENYAGAVTAEVVGRWLPRWDWNGIFIALDPTGEAVGVCRAQVGDPAYIDSPTVVPEHRPHHLQRPLVLTAGQWLRSQGASRLNLETWGDPPSTVAVYRDLGFDEVAHYLAYRHRLVR